MYMFLCGLVTLSTGQFLVVGASLCTVGCLEASLASIHQMPAVLKPPGCDNQKFLHCSLGGCITLVKNYCTKTVPLQELNELVYLIGLEQCLEHGEVLACLLSGSLCKMRMRKFGGLTR